MGHGPRIVVVNAHWNNRGDEAALWELVAGLRRWHPDCRITVLYKDRSHSSRTRAVDGVGFEPAQFDMSWPDALLAVASRGRVGRSPALKRLVKCIADADLVVHAPGGAVISDRFRWRKQLEYLLPFLVARGFRRPIVVAAPSFGPFTGRGRPLRRYLLRTARVICVREERSRTALASIGVASNVVVTADLALAGSVTPASPPAALASGPGRDRPAREVGITVTDLAWNVGYLDRDGVGGRIMDSFRDLIRFLLARGHRVLLIPQLFGNADDVRLLSPLVSEGVSLLDPDLDSRHQRGVIRTLHAVVGIRYHSIVFAAEGLVPFVAVAYEDKTRGFLDALGLGSEGLEAESLTSDALIEAFLRLERTYDARRGHLERVMPTVVADARRTLEHIAAAAGAADARWAAE